MVGMYYARLPEYDGIEIVVQASVYSTEYAEGQIIRQEPQADEIEEYGTKVFITVSKGPKPADYSVKMINLSGQTVDYAMQWIQDQGIDVANIKVIEEYHATIAAGNVISTEPGEGTELSGNERIILTVSLGKETGIMPDLLTRATSVNSAKMKMEGYRFTNVQYVPVNSCLLYTSPSPRD